MAVTTRQERLHDDRPLSAELRTPQDTAEAGSGSRRSLARLRSALWAVLGTALLGIGLIPAARVPILGDDFQALFETYTRGRGSFGTAVAYGWRAGMQAGHFNPVGQAIGAAYHYTVFALSASWQLPPQLFAALADAGLVWLTVLAATSVLVQGLRYAGITPRVPFWPGFACLAAITASTLELHPWSNDPVTSFLPAGWGSAVVAFAILGLALRSTQWQRTSWVDVVLAGVIGVFAVLYYEMLVGAVAGAAVVYAAAVLRARSHRDRAQLFRGLALFGAGVALPAVVFVCCRMLAVPQAKSNYTGTAVSLGPKALHTFYVATVGALPGGGWRYLSDSAGPFRITTGAGLFTLTLLAGIVVLALAWGRRPALTGRWSRTAAVPVVAVLVTWAATTATHATSEKYITEIRSPGQVYLYYVVAVVCVALLLAAFVLVVVPRFRPGVRTAGLVVLGAYLAVQLPLNWHLSQVSAAAYAANRNLATAAAESSVPTRVRCDTLLAWAQRPWPQYYRDAVIRDLQTDFRLAHGSAFCPDVDTQLQLQGPTGQPGG